MIFIYATILFLAALSPLVYMYFNKKARKHVKFGLLVNIISVFAIVLAISAVCFTNASIAASETADTVTETEGVSTNGLGLIAAALSIGLSCIGGGFAVASSASSALGAISENPNIFGQALIMVVLAEGIAIYGLIIAILILGKI